MHNCRSCAAGSVDCIERSDEQGRVGNQLGRSKPRRQLRIQRHCFAKVGLDSPREAHIRFDQALDYLPGEPPAREGEL